MKFTGENKKLSTSVRKFINKFYKELEDGKFEDASPAIPEDITSDTDSEDSGCKAS